MNSCAISARTSPFTDGLIHLITRENYVAYDGLPYDPETAQFKWMKDRMAKGESVNSGWLEGSGSGAWHASERVHKNFDKLSKVHPSQRQRTDLIDLYYWKLFFS